MIVVRSLSRRDKPPIFIARVAHEEVLRVEVVWLHGVQCYAPGGRRMERKIQRKRRASRGQHAGRRGQLKRVEHASVPSGVSCCYFSCYYYFTVDSSAIHLDIYFRPNFSTTATSKSMNWEHCFQTTLVVLLPRS